MENTVKLGLNTSLKGIGELIRTKHKVPKNQREYAWEDKHIYDFIKDITEAKSEDKLQYFMGTIVVTSSADMPEVVDGQQRMATTCLVIAAVRDYLISTKDRDNIKSADVINNKYLFETDAADLETYPYLTLNDIDNQFFLNYIIAIPEKKDLTTFKPSVPSHVRLKRAYEICTSEIKKIADTPPGKARKQVYDLIKYMHDKVQVIVLTAPDEASAFVLFETLNDRGIELAISDLLKNYLLGKAHTRLAEVKIKWHEMKVVLEAADAGEYLVMYIRQLWCSNNGLIREKDLYQAIKSNVINMAKAVAFTEDLSKNSKIYVQLVHPDQEFWKTYGFETFKSIKALNYISHTQPRPLILAILNHFEKVEVSKAIKLIEAWSFRFSITKRLGGEGMEREYSNLAKKITLGEIKKAAKLRTEMKNVPNDEDFKEGLRLYQIKKSILARYMLVEIEKLKGGKSKTEYIPNENPEVVNLEHILPKAFPAKNWAAFNDEDHAKFSTILGNLTIMLSDENENIAQNKFSDKKKIYEQSQIRITNELAKLSDWTPAELKKRQDMLSDLAIKRWSI